MITPLFYDDKPYRIVKDGDPTALELVNRHYSRQWKGNKSSRLFLGAGFPLVVIGVDGDWVFAWRLCKYRRDKESGVECAIFRNESPRLSSEIILECELLADEHFGRHRKFTYVHPGKIKSSNPGFCFKQAGWKRRERLSRNGLVLLYKECAPV